MNSKLDKFSALALLMLIWAGLYLPGLGGREISYNEGRRIFPSLTMLESGDWITCRLDGKEYYKKPPLINWMIASSVKLSGEKSEFSVRLPSALSVLAFVLLLAAMPSSFLSLEARTLGAIIFMSTVGVLQKGRLAEIDGPYTCLTGMAIICWLNLWAAGRSRWLLWPLSGLLVALGLLLKGPFVLLFFYSTVFCVLGSSRKWKELLHPAHIAGLFLSIGLFGLWVLAALKNMPAEAGGSAASDTGKDMLLALLPPDFRFWRWFEHGFIRSAAGFLPWLLLLPLFWMKGWRDRIKPEHTKLFGACLLSILIPFVLINLMPGTKGRYSMPVYPLLSVLAAWVLCREEALPELVKTLCRRLLELALLLLAAGGVTGSILTQNPLHLLVPAIASVIFLFTWKHREELNRAAALASLAGLGALAGMISYVIFIMPMTMKNEQCFSLGAKINEVSAPARNIFIYGLGNEAFMFYLKPSLRFINSSDDLPKEACTLLMLQGKESQQLLSDLQFEKRLPQRLACFKDDDLFYEVYRLGPAYKEGMRIPSDTRSLVEAN